MKYHEMVCHNARSPFSMPLTRFLSSRRNAGGMLRSKRRPVEYPPDSYFGGSQWPWLRSPWWQYLPCRRLQLEYGAYLLSAVTLPFLLSSCSHCVHYSDGTEDEVVRDEVVVGAGFGLVFNLWRTRSIFFTFVLFYLDELLSDCTHR